MKLSGMQCTVAFGVLGVAVGLCVGAVYLLRSPPPAAEVVSEFTIDLSYPYPCDVSPDETTVVFSSFQSESNKPSRLFTASIDASQEPFETDHLLSGDAGDFRHVSWLDNDDLIFNTSIKKAAIDNRQTKTPDKLSAILARYNIGSETFLWTHKAQDATCPFAVFDGGRKFIAATANETYDSPAGARLTCWDAASGEPLYEIVDNWDFHFVDISTSDNGDVVSSQDYADICHIYARTVGGDGTMSYRRHLIDDVLLGPIPNRDFRPGIVAVAPSGRVGGYVTEGTAYIFGINRDWIGATIATIPLTGVVKRRQAIGGWCGALRIFWQGDETLFICTKYLHRIAFDGKSWDLTGRWSIPPSQVMHPLANERLLSEKNGTLTLYSLKGSP